MWAQGQREALDKVMSLLRSSKVFVHHDDPLPLILLRDALPYAEQKYSQIDKEALAVILVVK